MTDVHRQASLEPVPAVSVLMPVFNGATTLEPCLKSILNQSESDFECVVVDDGSTDGSLDLVRHFQRRDSRIVVLERPHQGIVHALNTGLKACRAPLIARMDADDLMHRQRLHHQRRFLLEHPELSLVGCHVRLFPRRSLTQGMKDYESWLNSLEGEAAVRREAFVECPLAHPTWMARRHLLERLPYRTTRWAEDYDLLLRWMGDGLRVGTVPRALHFWREGPRRLSRTDGHYAPERFLECKAAFLAERFLASRPDYVLWGYGPTGRKLSQALRVHGKHPSVIVDVCRRKIGNTIFGAKVVPSEHLQTLTAPRIVVAVSGPAPRALIRAELGAMGFVELEHFVHAA